MSPRVPDDWYEGSFERFVTLRRGFDLPVQKRMSGDVPIYASNGVIGAHSTKSISGPCVVTGRSGTLGKVFYYEGGCWPLNTTLYVKDFHGNDPLFVYWFLSYFDLARFGTGTGVPTLNRNIVHKESVVFPPVQEQRRIADVLSSVDEAFQATQAVIEQTRKVKEGVLQRLLTKGIGHTRFKQTEIGEIPESWVIAPLSDFLTIKHGFAFSSQFFSNTETDTILLTPGNFSVKKKLHFGEKTRYYKGPIPSGFVLEQGDLLVVMTDLTQDMAILGNAVILESDRRVLHNQRIGRVSLSDGCQLYKPFACALLNSSRVQSEVKKSASGTTVRHSSPGRITRILCAIPPMDEQTRIAEVDAAFNAQEVTSEMKLQGLVTLKATLMSYLLTGRKRVPTDLLMAAE